MRQKIPAEIYHLKAAGKDNWGKMDTRYLDKSFKRKEMSFSTCKSILRAVDGSDAAVSNIISSDGCEDMTGGLASGIPVTSGWSSCSKLSPINNDNNVTTR